MVEETKNAEEQDLAVTDDVATDVKDEAVESEETKLPDNAVTIEDAGVLKKKVTIQVNRQRIDAKFDEMFGELNRTAQVPGFRIGRAPRRLIEKRFGKDVADDVRNALVGEAISDAMEKAEFKTIGEPEIKLDEIELPENDEMSFSFEVEVAPEFDLPDYKGIEIKRSVFEVTDERVEELLTAHRHRYGRFKPTDMPAEAGDVVVADVSIKGENIDYEKSNLELRVAPAQVEGIILEDLAKTLAGNKTGDSPSVKATVPAAHPNEEWREKEVTVTFDIQEVKRLELPELNEDFAKQEGFESLAEMRELFREHIQSRAVVEQQRAMRQQVKDYLLANTSFDLPEGLTQRHADRLLARRYVELLNRGVPRDQIDQNLQELQAAVSEQAETDMRLTFVLGKLAEAEEIEVDDGEVNARIAQMAAQYGRRPERLRQEMTHEGTLDYLSTAIREEKAIEKVLEEANIVDAEPEGDKKKDNKKKK